MCVALSDRIQVGVALAYETGGKLALRVQRLHTHLQRQQCECTMGTCHPWSQSFSDYCADMIGLLCLLQCGFIAACVLQRVARKA
jgi:hypothetical protein